MHFSKNTAATPAYKQGLHGGEAIMLAAKLGIQPDDLLDFSSNTNIFARHLSQKIFDESPYVFAHYPDQNCALLKQAIAVHEAQSSNASEGISAENILPGNGAADLIWLALRVLSPVKTLFIGPVFSEYIRASDALNLNYEIIATRAEDKFACTEKLLAQIENRPADLTVLCTPNNPGGITYANMGSILSRIRSPKILIDLSYREFLYGSASYTQNFWQNLKLLKRQGSEILCLHSFTKFFCCPGLRLGYLTGEKNAILNLTGQIPSWNVSQFAQKLGVIFLKRVEEYRATLLPLEQARRNFGINLRSLAVFDPDLILEGPVFFCCKSKTKRASEVQNILLQHGVLARDCDNVPGMPPGFVRVQVRATKDNNRLVDILKNFS
jgi:threonine-phosphate decarboxylase